MRARLFCPVGALQIDHTFQEGATLGRSPDNSLVLQPDVLSGHHMKVSWDPRSESYTVEDLGSSNGTRLDGAPLREPRRLGHLHLITLAEQFHIVFQDLDRCAARHPRAAAGDSPQGVETTGMDKTMMMSLPIPIPGSLQPTSTDMTDTTDRTERTIFERLPLPLPGFLRRPGGETADAGRKPTPPPPPGARPQPSPTRPLAPGEIPVPGTPRLEPGQIPGIRLYLEVDEDGGQQRYPLQPGRHILGRGRQAALQIPSPHLSRSHAVLTVEGDRVSLRDDGSKNSTFVDGTKILDEIVVEPGQEIAFGLLKARLVSDNEPANPQDRRAPS